MNHIRYTILLLAGLLTGCSKWNLDDKIIKPTVTPTGIAVTLNDLKPKQLDNTSATISFKVDKPDAAVEYGVVLTTDPAQVASVIAGTVAPVRRVGAAGVNPDNFAITGLSENTLYYAVPYAKNATGQYNFSPQAVTFQTKFGRLNAIWGQLASFPAERAFAWNPIFTIDGKVYVGGATQAVTGNGKYYFKQLYVYDPLTNIWTQLKDFPGTARLEPTVAVLNGKAYVMFGAAAGQSSYVADAWEYDPTADSWRQLTNPPATRTGGMGVYNMQAGAIPFVYNNRACALFGRGTYNNDFKQVNIYNSLFTLDPTGAGSWDVSFPFDDKGVAKNILYAAARSGAFSVQYNGWVYFGGGLAASNYNATGANIPYSTYFNSRQIWGYNTDTKDLKQIALLPTTFNDCSDPNLTYGRMQGMAFLVGSKMYISDCSSQIWIIDLASGNFTPQLSATLRHPSNDKKGIGVSVGTKIYFGLLPPSGQTQGDWWEFVPN